MKKLDSIFKPSNSKSNEWNLAKTFLQTSIFWLVFLFFIPKAIWIFEEAFSLPTFSAMKIFGWTLLGLFSILGLNSGYTMSWVGKGTPLPLDCPNELVVAGPYKYVRNPMAVAGIGQGISVGLLSGSFFVIFYAFIGAILWHYTVRPIEEKDLENRFGKSYLDYKNRTKCWVPKSFYRFKNINSPIS